MPFIKISIIINIEIDSLFIIKFSDILSNPNWKQTDHVSSCAQSPPEGPILNQEKPGTKVLDQNWGVRNQHNFIKQFSYSSNVKYNAKAVGPHAVKK